LGNQRRTWILSQNPKQEKLKCEMNLHLII
jgi:hypothetical protein